MVKHEDSQASKAFMEVVKKIYNFLKSGENNGI